MGKQSNRRRPSKPDPALPFFPQAAFNHNSFRSTKIGSLLSTPTPSQETLMSVKSIVDTAIAGDFIAVFSKVSLSSASSSAPSMGGIVQSTKATCD